MTSMCYLNQLSSQLRNLPDAIENNFNSSQVWILPKDSLVYDLFFSRFVTIIFQYTLLF